MRSSYRGDVDGLRAIAILLVVAFHAFPRRVPGGFVGVDVFFVISGFLITSLIASSLHDGTFTFADFYARRVKRLFPALVAVLATCLVVGWFVMFPGEFRDLGKHAAAGAGFAANFVFLQEIGYFAFTASQKPLLHLWSLGIEEQFYIVWPALIVLVWRWKNGPLIAAGIICVGSFIWNVVLTRSDPGQAFFLPFTRFWELMVGCLLALWAWPESGASPALVRISQFHQRHRQTIRECASWAGVVLITVGVVVIKPHYQFPGWWALLPTVGTALIIAAGPEATINRVLLSHRAMIYLGLISYPLYLWHWPILSFARIIHFKEPPDLVRALCVVLAFALAYLTYRYIERPIRFGAQTTRKPVLTAAALAATGCLGLLVYAGSGVPSRFPKELQALANDFFNDPEENHQRYRCLHGGVGMVDFETTCDGTAQPGARRVVVWGDSHGAHLGPGFDDLQPGEKIQFAQFNSGGCPPVPNFVSGQRKLCTQLNDLALSRIAALKPDTVIMAARWELYDGTLDFGRVEAGALRESIARLKALGVKRVVVVGPFPSWSAWVPQLRASRVRLALLFRPDDASSVERNTSFLNDKVYAINAQIRKAIEGTGAEYIDPQSTLCNDEGCLLVVPGAGGKPIYWDDNHLSRSGSIYFVEQNRRAFLGQ